MTPYKEDIFRELKQVLAEAEPEQIERLLSDIAHGEFVETAQTRAGSNDNQCNVTNINHVVGSVKAGASRPRNPEQLSDASRQTRRTGYSS
ncbi:hypothetical protein [uncultured Sulfitobacter sp.]|uniref:hypothetical protein n=1 Tax=uncultured Sulfitobacter sp. TaxID=191468 RepID=UPI0026092F29|nr:hypothetical protein [uncultured Sulfitobacter sp.]